MSLYGSKSARIGLIASFALLCLPIFAPHFVAQVDENGGWDQSWIKGLGELLRYDYRRYSKPDIAAAKDRWAQIEADSSRPQEDEWAGEYSIHPGFEVGLDHLRWSTKSGFVQVYVYTCLPELRFLNFGTVTNYTTAVVMTPEYPPHSGRKILPAKQFLKVKWGERHYLIEEDRIEEFCDSIAGVGVYEEGVVNPGFWLKSADWEKSAEGLPSLPLGYEHHLKKPIEAHVLAVGKRYVEHDPELECMTRTITPVRINAGTSDGVKVGIAFKVSVPEDGGYGYVKIVKVFKNSSEALFIPHGFSMCGESGETSSEKHNGSEANVPNVAIGWRLTIRPIDE